jgi:5-(carboxyamino)imidazole ribonucleotide mutase
MDKGKGLVSIVMPNEKDLEIMNESMVTLKHMEIPFEVAIVSAHRSPYQMIEYAKNARERHIAVIIATARGAAHLPGMIAAFTTLPVIAVPLESQLLDGIDSILSMLQMPEGVPVATVSVNGARNAAILAAQIISLHNENVKTHLDELKSKLSAEVEQQASRIKNQFSNTQK